MDLLLQANFQRLLTQYTENLDAVRALQSTVIHDILPSVADELELDDPESLEWATEWLEDACMYGRPRLFPENPLTPREGSLFQILRVRDQGPFFSADYFLISFFACVQRNKFTRSFAMESVRKTLVWRFAHLWPPDPTARPPLVHCLPPPAHDPFGRPILVVKVVSFNDSSDAYKPLIIRGLEQLRLHLKRLNGGRPTPPIFQYVLLLDLENLSTQSLVRTASFFFFLQSADGVQNIDLVTWTLREAIPQFPGLLAAGNSLLYASAAS
jgi:hypothetical protein